MGSCTAKLCPACCSSLSPVQGPTIATDLPKNAYRPRARRANDPRLHDEAGGHTAGVNRRTVLNMNPCPCRHPCLPRKLWTSSSCGLPCKRWGATPRSWPTRGGPESDACLSPRSEHTSFPISMLSSQGKGRDQQLPHNPPCQPSATTREMVRSHSLASTSRVWATTGGVSDSCLASEGQVARDGVK